MNWQYVEIDQVYLIHKRLIDRAGTKATVRDFGLLHSAVERPKATYDGKDLYPSVFLKSAALLQSICLNHPFTDGNKRTAWLVSKRLLFLNGYHLVAEAKQAADFMVRVDNAKPKITEVFGWLRKHSRKI